MIYTLAEIKNGTGFAEGVRFQTYEEYNGWVNYETWLVSLWLSNDQGTYEAVNELLTGQVGNPVHQASGALEEFVDNLVDPDDTPPPAGLATDLMRSALADVNWRDIVENWVTGIDAIEINDERMIVSAS